MSLASVTLGWGDARLQMCLPDVLGPLQQWVSGCDWGLGCVWGPWGAALEGVQCWGAGRRCSLSPGHPARGCTLQLCHFGSSAGNMLTWKGGKLEPVWGHPPSHGDWLAGAKGCRMGAGRWQDLELVGVRGVWGRCWKMRLLPQGWMAHWNQLDTLGTE